MKIGLELEGFYLVDNSVAVVPANSLPHDDCGWLVEYRGEPHDSAYQAVGSLIAERERVNRLIPAGASVSFEPHMTVPRAIKLAARRRFTKGTIKFQNLYGKQPSSLDHAGIHVSFTNPQTISSTDRHGNNHKTTVNQLFDFVQIFRELDRLYATEIKAARRVPGFYEIKDDLRIEYRSLPNNIDLWELAARLDKLVREV